MPYFLYDTDKLLMLFKNGLKENDQLALKPNFIDICCFLHEKKKEYKVVFNLMLKYKSPKIFDFMKRVHLDIDFENDMPKLLMINPFETVSYLMLKYGTYQKDQVFTNCMRILSS